MLAVYHSGVAPSDGSVMHRKGWGKRFSDPFGREVRSSALTQWVVDFRLMSRMDPYQVQEIPPFVRKQTCEQSGRYNTTGHAAQFERSRAAMSTSMHLD